MFGEDVSAHQWPEAVGPQGPYGGYGPTVMAIAWSQFALATVLIFLRIYTRYFIKRHGGWALIWTLVSWLLGFIAQVVFTTAVYRSMDGFSTDWTVPTALKYTWSAIYLTFLSIGIGKFAVAAFVLEIQGPTYIKARRFIYFLAISNIIFDVIYVLYLAFRCHPLDNVFVMHAPVHCTGSKMQARNFGYFIGSWNAVTDFILALYPVFLFWNVQIASHVKWGMCAVMSLGTVACAMACVKTWDLMYIADTTELSFKLYCILTWSFTESWVVLICCSIPPLWSLVRRSVYQSKRPLNSAKVWIGASSHGYPASLEDAPSARGTVKILSSGKDGTMSSRGRTDSQEADVELVKHTQPQRPTSRGPNRGPLSPVLTYVEGTNRAPSRSRSRPHHSRTRTMGSQSYIDTGSLSSSDDHDDDFVVDEPQRGGMISRDAGRPGIIVTREYTVGTERRRQGHESKGSQEDLVGTQGAEFGSGRPYRHDWGSPDDAV